MFQQQKTTNNKTNKFAIKQTTTRSWLIVHLQLDTHHQKTKNFTQHVLSFVVEHSERKMHYVSIIVFFGFYYQIDCHCSKWMRWKDESFQARMKALIKRFEQITITIIIVDCCT